MLNLRHPPPPMRALANACDPGSANPTCSKEQGSAEGGGSFDEGVQLAHEGSQTVQGGGNSGYEAQSPGEGKLLFFLFFYSIDTVYLPGNKLLTRPKYLRLQRVTRTPPARRRRASTKTAVAVNKDDQNSYHTVYCGGGNKTTMRRMSQMPRSVC